MTADHFDGIERFEAGLWKIADDLRANANLASNEYFMPIMGLLFLRQATNRYFEAIAAIQADKAREDPRAAPGRWRFPAPPCHDASRRHAVRRDFGAGQERKPGAAMNAAMDSVENHFPPLAGQLPKDYERFEDDFLKA